MRMTSAMTIILTLLGSAAYAQQASPQAWTFRCPAPNTVIEANDGIRIQFRSAAANEPHVCVSGTDFRRALGVWDMRQPVFRSNMGELAGLFPATSGRRVAINYFDTDASNNSIARRDVFRIVGFPTITVPAGSFATVQIERFSEFTTVNGGVYQRRDTIWLSTRDGAPVKATYEQVAGRTPGTRLVDWEAVRVARPAPRPAT